MKKILLPTLIVCSLFANEQNYIELGGGFNQSKDNFSTESKENISSLKSAESENEGIPFINFFYGKDINESVNIYASSELGGLNLGSVLETNYGLFDFGVKADLMGEEWKNPFLTGVKRDKTDTKEYGVYFGYGFELSENIESMIRYEFSKKTYDKDDVIKDLKREGKRHILSLQNSYMSTLFNKNTLLMNTLSYEKYDAQGDASSYNNYNMEFGLSSEVSENVELSLFGNYGIKEYEKTNTIINKKVDVTTYGVHFIATLNEPFAYKNVYTSLTTGYEKEEANHDFYDKENTMAIISLGYKF